jgi:hypothetical protein
MGTVASADIKLGINQQDEPIGLNIYSASSTSNAQTGIYTYLGETGSGLKTGILGQVYANTSSTSDVYGVRGEAHQSTSNAYVYGIYGSVSGSGNGLRWAGYFDGDVNVATQMRIGGGNVLPHESALLDLSSTDKGLLLPRMTAAQREAINPLTHGLVVFDMDSLDAYVYGGPGGWNPMGGSSSAPGLWSEINGFGIYYDEGLVGVGGSPYGSTSMAITADDEDTGLYLYQSTDGSATKYGARIEHTGATAGTNYGLHSKVTASSLSSDPSYGVYGEVFQGSSPGTVYGIYGKVIGSGSTDRWAGYFEGNVRVTGNVSFGEEVASGYKLSVDGKVACEEVRVELSEAWPDYVFDQEYHLMPLHDLKEYITEYHRLPGLPSAVEVSQSGIEIGDTQRKLVEKIEELTLYVIELKAELDVLRAELRASSR